MKNLDFVALVNDIINTNTDGFDTGFNEWDTCPICSESVETPNFVMKLEHINEDVKYLVSQKHYTYLEEHAFEAPPIDSDRYLEKLTLGTRNELFKVLRSHYELFGYDPYLDLLQK